MPVFEAPADDDEEDEHPPRQSYNFAPGYNGLVYRADVPYYGAGPRSQKVNDIEESVKDGENDMDVGGDSNDQSEPVKYKLQSMKWGRFKIIILKELF